jgi:hypothetical protein
MPDIYDDPVFQTGNRVRFDVVGDRVRGTVLSISKYTNANGAALQYQLGQAVTQQAGRQARHDTIEMIAGSTNLVGQLVMKRPRGGDVLDVTLIELRPSMAGNPLKVYKIDVEGNPGAGPAPTPQEHVAQRQAAAWPPDVPEVSNLRPDAAPASQSPLVEPRSMAAPDDDLFGN